MKFASIDFEYNKSNEKHPTLVSCVVKGRDFKKPQFFWLHNSPDGKAKLVQLLKSIANTHTLLAWGATNEARCLWALGLNPLAFKWICLWVEWRQLQNKCYKYMYGHVYKHDGNHVVSRPPDRPAKSHEIVGDALIDVIWFFWQIYLGGKHKEQMRDLILSGGPFTTEEARAIIGYNGQDVEYLGKLFEEIRARNKHLTPEIALRRGRYCAALALSESLGIPLNMDRIESVRVHHGAIVRRLIEELNGHYPFYLPKAGGGYSRSQKQIDAYIKAAGLASRWPLTEKSGKFEWNEDVLKKFKNYNRTPEIKQYLRIQRMIGDVGIFSPGRIGKFLERVGSDGRLRPYFNQFRSQTSRNQPPSSHFVFAMSRIMRCLIEPPPGRVILSDDWSAQEFAIAAILSGDANMIWAYKSGDPYLGYAKQTKSIPKSATRETHGEVRDELKESVLSIQFGSGARGIAESMSAKTGKHYTERDGRRFLELHKRTYRGYWDFLTKITRRYESGKPIFLRDGWYLGPDNKNRLSVCNFPMQGNGAAIMREGQIRCWERGVEVNSPLHDNLYSECAEADEEESRRLKLKAMAEAVEVILGSDIEIRVGSETHRHGELWVEGKAKATFEMLRQYLVFDNSDLI